MGKIILIAKYVLPVIISMLRNGQSMQNMRARAPSWKFAYLSGCGFPAVRACAELGPDARSPF